HGSVAGVAAYHSNRSHDGARPGNRWDLAPPLEPDRERADSDAQEDGHAPDLDPAAMRARATRRRTVDSGWHSGSIGDTAMSAIAREYRTAVAPSARVRTAIREQGRGRSA